jgi:hypothetical protein
MRHQDFLAAGARIFAISIDPPERNAAMVAKLSLPFPCLSDPDRSQAIQPYGVADEKDERHIARPAVVVVTTDHGEAFRFVSRDFADRIAEDQVLASIQELQLPATTQPIPQPGPADPSPRSLSPSNLRIYFRGARFAAQAMGLRHAHYAEEIKTDSKAYVAEMDRFTEALDWLRARTDDQPKV